MDEKLAAIAAEYRIPILLSIAGVLFILLGLVIFPRNDESNTRDSGMQIVEQTFSNQVYSLIHVDIAGAVVKPGIYLLPRDARVGDLIASAGGFTKDADSGYISQRLNQAGKLSDGVKIYIPETGENSTDKAGDNEGMININAASLVELDTLPGIGPSTADKIVTGRPYEKIEDLLDRKIVASSVWEKIKGKVTVY